jgi:hypothetical protein
VDEREWIRIKGVCQNRVVNVFLGYQPVGAMANVNPILGITRRFFFRAIGTTIGIFFLLIVVAALFESSLDSDFAPAQSGAWFAAYHGVLSDILFVLLAPMWLLDKFALSPPDAICLLFCSACYGLLLSLLWLAVVRVRQKARMAGSG